MELVAKGINELKSTSQKLIDFAGDGKIFLFYGDMGAGKTTFIKSLCECLGTSENIASPTFSIVNEYQGKDSKIYHFDFYRLKNESEALDMGYEEYFYSGQYCFIEWPEKISGLLPEHYVSVKIQVLPGNERSLTIGKI